MRVTVFGGSSPKAGEPAYEEALQLGRMLGSAGFTVLTGGYIGTMEAVSRGAAEAGGHVIGITCEQIENWRPVGANIWVQEEQRHVTIPQRLVALIEGCDAAIALPGGAGTLAEISVMWNLLQTGALSPRPLILVGPAWRATFSTLFETSGPYIQEKHRDWLLFAPDNAAAFSHLSGIISSHPDR